MFRIRLLTTVVLVPLIVALVGLGGLWLFAIVAALLTVAVLEFCALMRQDRFHPAPAFAVALLWLVLLDVQFPHWTFLGQRLLEPGLALVLLASLTWQLGHRRGAPTADWALAMAGPLYVGWCGAHVLRLRGLPEGAWWVLTALPAVWLADSGAYLIGRAWGRHKLAPTLSPGKTWEGYIGGVATGATLTAGLAALWGLRAGPLGPSPLAGLGLGLLVSAIAPLGDLAVSMMKRQVGAKDTGALFPGHGGALDRVDSSLWAAVIGYYFVLWLHGG